MESAKEPFFLINKLHQIDLSFAQSILNSAAQRFSPQPYMLAPRSKLLTGQFAAWPCFAKKTCLHRFV
jgi:hypothetical protein